MVVRYKHTWSAAILLVGTLLCLKADAASHHSSGEVEVTGPGGEAALHTNQNQVQVWSCHNGTMATCTIRSEGGSMVTPSGPRLPPGAQPHWKVNFAKLKKQANAAHRRR